MATISIFCFDFMDGDAVAGVSLDVRLFAVPRYLQPPDPQPEPGQGGSPHPQMIVEFDLAQVVSRQATSGPDGRASVVLSGARAAFERAAATALNGRLPNGVVGVIEVDVDVDGLRRTWRFAEDLPGTAVGTIGPDGSADLALAIDFALTIVGHTTTTSTRLLIDLRVTPGPSDAYVSVIAADGDSTPLAMVPIPAAPRPVTISATGLRPGTRHTYEVRIQRPGRPPTLGRRLARGSFRTPASSPTRLTLAFASCHRPTDVASLERWEALARRTDLDLLLLIGDQIYEDAVSGEAGTTWEERYLARYRRFFAPHVVRQTLRSTPTLFALDDHEVKDDFGLVPVTEDVDEATNDRRLAALRAFGRFQDALNPPGRPEGQLDYEFRIGPVAGYVLDCRTHRTMPPASVLEARTSEWPGAPASPVLGEAQRARLRTWADASSTRGSDVIVLVATVPLAFLPVGELLRLLDEIESTAAEDGLGFGALLGGAIGLLTAGLATGGLGAGGGAYVGALIGGSVAGVGAGALAADKLASKGFADLTERDLADQWTWRPNQQDLAFVLNVLFDLANDRGPGGTVGMRPRAVFVLGGDVHSGAMHEIVSAAPGHRRQRAIHHLISSPISKTPANDRIYENVVRHIRPDRDIGHVSLLQAGLSGNFDGLINETFGESRARFVLDDSGARRYATEIIDYVAERNLGTLRVELLGRPSRQYRFVATVEGRHHAIVQAFDLDLNAPVIIPNPLVGDVLAVEGSPVFLRAHEVGTGFGPPAARIDEEAVVELDALPGRYFGLSLRPDMSGPIASVDAGEEVHRAMWALLRRALRRRSRVRLEYVRTGLTTGRILRVQHID